MNDVDNTRKHTHLSLCAGYGGIDLGLKGAGFDIDGTVFVEVEAFASYNLVKKIEAGALGAGVIWPDLKTFPFRKFRGCFDILSGGFPCQPFSQAGKGNADEDPRHLFPYILRGIYECRPDIVVLENVEGIVSAKLKGDHWRDPAGTPVLLHVIRELERVGYKATAVPSSASEVGAPHQRNRWFIIGVANDSSNGRYGRSLQNRIREWGLSQLPQPHEGERTEVRSTAEGCCNDENVAYDRGGGCQDGVPGPIQRQEGDAGEFRDRCTQPWPARPGQEQFEWEPPRVVEPFTRLKNRHGVVGDTKMLNGKRCEQGHGDAQTRGTGTSRPSDHEKTKPPLGGNADGAEGGMGYAELRVSCDNRTDELRLLGNGVVPQSCSDAVIRGLKELMEWN